MATNQKIALVVLFFVCMVSNHGKISRRFCQRPVVDSVACQMVNTNHTN